MSLKRIKVINGIYHCMSRLVCWAPEFDGEAKRVFVRQMRRQEDFCGVKVMTYCLMKNHFHILVRVPEARDVKDNELVKRYRALYSENRKRFVVAMKPEVLAGILAEGGERATIVRAELLARMHDVSVFMRELKQRFSIWYNHRHGRHGTLWSERFKSVLVEGRPSALKIVSAYIDLNPVRAGLVGDPKEYVWSGYGAACGGDRTALFGLAEMMGGNPRVAESLRRTLADYRMLLYGKGALTGSGGKRICLDAQAAQNVFEQGGYLSLSELLLCRIRAFSHGMVFGGKGFVDELAILYRNKLVRIRKRLPAPVKGMADNGIYTFKAQSTRHSRATKFG